MINMTDCCQVNLAILNVAISTSIKEIRQWTTSANSNV